MIIQVCVGSSCCLKGSYEIVEFLQKAVADNHLDADVTLAGSFCSGRCNRVGVTIFVDDDVYTGVTPDTISAFFDEKVLNPLNAERN